jgi:hypothetical protein
MNGPYFEGQMASHCGHYHPDVLRVKDVWVDGDTLLRVVDCVHCGRLEYQIATAGCEHYRPGATVGPVNDPNEFAEYRRRWHEELRKGEN